MKNCRMNILIGRNASGKTHYLMNKIQSNNRKDVVTNLVDLDMLGSFDIDFERAELLEDVLKVDTVYVNHSMLYIKDDTMNFSRQFCNLLFLLCINRTVLVLDEPDAELDEYEIGHFYDVLFKLGWFYNEIWIATHDDTLLFWPFIDYYCIENSLLKGISCEAAAKILRGTKDGGVV